MYIYDICTYVTVNYKLKTILLIGHRLYLNLYGTFLIKSNDVTFISIALYTVQIVSKILDNNNIAVNI